jgi:hypothetical protein
LEITDRCAPKEWNDFLPHCSASRIQGLLDYAVVDFSRILKSAGNKNDPIIAKVKTRNIQKGFFTGMVPITPGSSVVVDFGELFTGFQASVSCNR